MEINVDELRLDDLGVNGLKIYQNKDKYCFTSDAVILANFCKCKRGERVADLGSGSGIIGILLAGKYGAQRVDCVEIQPYFAAMSELSVRYNNLQDKVFVHNMPMQRAWEKLGQHYIDVVVSNPPYTRAGDGERNSNDEIAICRHEVKVSLPEVIESAAKLLKYGGRFYMIHQAERLAEIFYHMKSFRLEPKRVRFVEGRVGLKPTLVMIEAHSNGNTGLIVERNLTLYDKQGKETEELRQIYSRQD